MGDYIVQVELQGAWFLEVAQHKLVYSQAVFELIKKAKVTDKK